MLIHAEFGLSGLKGVAFYRVGTNTEEPQNWGALKLRSLVMGGAADPKT